jgi:hypothetical protein
MNFVEPIRDRKKIAQIKNLLRGKRHYHDLLCDLYPISQSPLKNKNLAMDNISSALAHPPSSLLPQAAVKPPFFAAFAGLKTGA